MSIFHRMMTIDRRVIYLVLAVALIYPMFRPIGLPVASEAPAEEMYRQIAAMPEGTPILYSADLDADGIPELKPMIEVLIDLSLQRGHRIFLMSLWADGNNMISRWTEKLFESYGATYGKDYIHLGYIPSYQAFMDASRVDFIGACNGGIDRNRERLDQFPIMQGITRASDFAAVVSFGVGDPSYSAWMQYWYATGDIKAVYAGMVASSYPQALNAYNAGNLKGVAGGVAGAATLEKCHGIVGAGYGASDSQSFGHLAIIAFLILGNVGYFGARYVERNQRDASYGVPRIQPGFSND